MVSVKVGRDGKRLDEIAGKPFLRSKAEAEQEADARVVFFKRGLKIDIVKIDDERRCESQLRIHGILGRDSNGHIPARVVPIDPSRAIAAVKIGVDQSEPCKRH